MLGQELVPRLIKRDHQIYALSRKERHSDLSNPIYVKGDVTTQGLGIGSLSVDAVLHMAALTSLRARHRDAHLLVNYHGTKNVIQWCKANNVKRFFYVSTIYVCGDRNGTFSESQLGVHQRFKNNYEQSKFFAESLLRRVTRLDVTVFRPGILVGGYSDGKTTLFEGFYRPLKAMVLAHVFAERRLKLPKREIVERVLHLPNLRLPIRLYGDPESLLSLTPVDWAADEIARLIDISELQRTYHIVSDRMPTLALIAESINEALSLRGFHVNPSHTRNPLDMFYNRLMNDFHSYLQNQPKFETSVGHRCPPIDREYLKRVIVYWRSNDMIAKDSTLFEQRDVVDVSKGA